MLASLADKALIDPQGSGIKSCIYHLPFTKIKNPFNCGIVSIDLLWDNYGILEWNGIKVLKASHAEY